MKNIRIIPRLDIKGPNLVKGIHLEGLRVLGKPEDFAKFYYKEGADELIFQDTVASLYQRNSLKEIINRTAENIFIPLTVGGGIRSVQDINSCLRAGADKVSINTAAILNPKFINQASQSFGSSTIVIAIEAIKEKDGKYYAYTDNGREHTGVEIVSWAKEIEERGAGELLLTSIDKEGTGKGFDITLIKTISENVNIPIIAHGGASSIFHIEESIEAGSDGIALSSMLHYNYIKNHFSGMKNEYEEGNTEFLKLKSSYKMFGSENLKKIKSQLISKKFHIRGIS